jgi:dienelactone hydrolase
VIFCTRQRQQPAQSAQSIRRASHPRIGQWHAAFRSAERRGGDRDNVTRSLRFDIGLLASRLAEVTRWLVVQPAARDLGIGYFGSSIGGGAALVAAAEVGQRIDAVVSRGGRPDLAGDALPRMQSPTLLIVGGYDDAVIRL